MKVIFLDFDGVLNSKQEVLWHRHRNQKWYRRLYFKAAYFLYKCLFTPMKPLQRMQGGSTGYRIYRAIFNWWCLRIDDNCDFCPIACSNVQYVLDHEPEAVIVISSTWRSYGLEYCKKILKKNGIDASRVVGRTGGWEDGGNQRGDQIQGWLMRHQRRVEGLPALPGSWYGVDEAKPESVTHFCAIDDDSDMDAVRENFVKTSSQTGFMLFDAYAVLRKLGTRKPGAETLFDPMHD